MRDEWVSGYLGNRVIGFLKQYGFDNGCEKLIVIHVFDETDTNIRIDFDGEYQVCGGFAEDSAEISSEGGVLSIRLSGGACALYLCDK